MLPSRESAVYLAIGPSVLRMRDLPRYAEMARYAFGRLNPSGEQFHNYRRRVDHGGDASRTAGRACLIRSGDGTRKPVNPRVPALFHRFGVR